MPATSVLALSDTHRDLWWGAVIGGFVVVLAVAALLTILVLLVRRTRDTNGPARKS